MMQLIHFCIFVCANRLYTHTQKKYIHTYLYIQAHRVNMKNFFLIYFEILFQNMFKKNFTSEGYLG